MRVQENLAAVVVNMGKKKNNKSKRQVKSDDDENNETDGPKHCAHINKSVNVNTVRKCLKKTPLGQCSLCSSTGEPAAEAEQPSIYLCLQCAHQGCDRLSQHKHALHHYETEHSIPHDVALNLSNFSVWCYACDDFVATNVSRKVGECIEFVRRHSTTPQEQPALSLKQNTSAAASSSELTVDRQTTSNKTSAPKIKGLTNLGNTCFFNAVLQILRQTHLLEDGLRECHKKGQVLELTNVVVKSNGDHVDNDDDGDAETSDCDEDAAAQSTKQEHLSIELGDCGQMLHVLLNVFDDMSFNSTSKQSYVNPCSLFNQVCYKASRFKGFQQQDSHELLRYLLDALKADEIKRSQMAILKAFNVCSDKKKVKDLSDDQKQKIKDFGHVVKQTFIDKIFGGVFISTVVCHRCHTPKQIFEPFLDISLPILHDKTRDDDEAGSRQQDQQHQHGGYYKPSLSDESRPTKNRLKRQQKQARKQHNKAKKKKVPTATLR